MFYIFIFESIGTSELMLIGLVALIVFGPRKLPEIARMFGKTMAEFRRSTDDFKKTWQQELDLEETKKSLEKLTDFSEIDKEDDKFSISRNSLQQENKIIEASAPEIKEISKSEFDDNFAGKEISKSEELPSSKITGGKQNWL